jgi:hypothetical protein
MISPVWVDLAGLAGPTVEVVDGISGSTMIRRRLQM